MQKLDWLPVFKEISFKHWNLLTVYLCSWKEANFPIATNILFLKSKASLSLLWQRCAQLPRLSCCAAIWSIPPPNPPFYSHVTPPWFVYQFTSNYSLVLASALYMRPRWDQAFWIFTITTTVTKFTRITSIVRFTSFTLIPVQWNSESEQSQVSRLSKPFQIRT